MNDDNDNRRAYHDDDDVDDVDYGRVPDPYSAPLQKFDVAHNTTSR